MFTAFVFGNWSDIIVLFTHVQHMFFILLHICIIFEDTFHIALSQTPLKN